MACCCCAPACLLTPPPPHPTLITGEALIIAKWPAPGSTVDRVALSHFEALKSLVKGIRNARAEYGVEEKRKIAATLVVEDAALRAALTAELPVRGGVLRGDG